MESNIAVTVPLSYMRHRNPFYSMDIARPAYPNRREFGDLSQEYI